MNFSLKGLMFFVTLINALGLSPGANGGEVAWKGVNIPLLKGFRRVSPGKAGHSLGKWEKIEVNIGWKLLFLYSKENIKYWVLVPDFFAFPPAPEKLQSPGYRENILRWIKDDFSRNGWRLVRAGAKKKNYFRVEGLLVHAVFEKDGRKRHYFEYICVPGMRFFSIGMEGGKACPKYWEKLVHRRFRLKKTWEGEPFFFGFVFSFVGGMGGVLGYYYSKKRKMRFKKVTRDKNGPPVSG